MEMKRRKKKSENTYQKEKKETKHMKDYILYDTTEKTTKKDLLKRGGLLFSQRLNT